jgi:serine phosphatase RsbU (regulator of sigma subunit)
MSTAAFTLARHPVLAVWDGQKLHNVVISSSRFTIGRGPDRDLVLDDPRISRNHAVLVRNGASWTIEDSGSRFGTFVNGARITEQVLRQGDHISFGESPIHLTFSESGDTTRREWATHVSTQSHANTDMQKLALFLQAVRSLNRTHIVNDVLAILLDYALKLTGAQRAFVFLRQPTGELAFSHGRDAHGNALTEDTSLSRSVVEETASTNAEFLVGDVLHDGQIAQRQSVIALDLRTVIALPLRGAGSSLLGVLYLDSHVANRDLTSTSSDILRGLAQECGLLIENARLVKAEHDSLQYHQELAIASTIQRRLIRTELPQSEYAQIRARTIPCKEVGGDFYDVVQTPTGTAVVLVDVSGKGVAAALLASVIHGMLYAQLSSGLSPLEAIASLNQFVYSRVSGEKYATLLVAHVEPSGEVELVNCGHVCPLLIREGELTTIEDGCFPVGLFENAEFATRRLQLTASDRLVLLTDGITEAERADGTDFASALLNECLRHPDCLEFTFERLKEFLAETPAQDDCTLLELTYDNRRAS